MRSVAGSFIMICGITLAGLRVAVPYPQGILSQVLLERNVHMVMEKLIAKTITSLPPDASQLFVSNLMDMSHMLAIWCQAVLMVLAGYLLSRMVKG